ncbi:hypothetical protein PSYCG_05940 [Psychrobacter sp. G]|nr:hypothetical protein PSYCG_05940 [Psychrobacter sp. G]
MLVILKNVILKDKLHQIICFIITGYTKTAVF